jgi:hypothetical protein
MRDRIGHQLFEILGGDHAAVEERGNALDRDEQDEADAVWLAGLECAYIVAHDYFEQRSHP